MEEKRTAALFINLRPSLRRRIDLDAASKGQKLAEWAERVFTNALEGDNAPESVTDNAE